MDERQVALFYGAVLHDVGKAVQRKDGVKIKHPVVGANYLKDFNVSKDIIEQVKYHHVSSYKSTVKDGIESAGLSKDNLAYITYIADNISSATDRRWNDLNDTKQDFSGFYSDIDLEDIFNRFGETKSQRHFKPQLLDLETKKIFPEETRVARGFSKSDYAQIINELTYNLQQIDFSVNYTQSLLHLLEATMSYIPSSTNSKQVVDISLYDHLKLTAAFAGALYQYLKENNITNYENELLKNERKFKQKNAFMLVAFDISGITEFIYTITSSGAYKQLRSRAFYVAILSEWLSDNLLKRCDLTRANLLFSAMGKTYFLLANTAKSKEVISSLEEEFNEFLLQNYSLELQVHFGMRKVSADDLQTGKAQDNYRKLFTDVEQQIADKKLSKLSPSVLQKLNFNTSVDGRECNVCHNTTNLLVTKNKCSFCEKLENFSTALQREDNFAIGTDSNGIPIGKGRYLRILTSEDDILPDDIIYTKNQFNIGKQQETYLWVPDYSDLENNEFNLYAERNWSTKGVKKLGALICGIDDLKWAMLAGFSEQEQGLYMSLSRGSALMRHINMFLQIYLNKFAEEMGLSGTIINSNGGQVFIIGAWDSLLEFAFELNKKFVQWTAGKMTLSMGLGIYPKKTPINIISEKTHSLYEQAQNNDGNSLCIFDAEICYSFKDFIDIYETKLAQVDQFFTNTSEKGNSFIYTLLGLVRDSSTKLAFARLVYWLSRVEQEVSDKVIFKKFSANIIQWFKNPVESKKLEVALLLYVYKNRKK